MKKLILLLISILALLLIPLSASALEEVNLSLGKPYTRTAAYINPTYPDTDNKELTDGILGWTSIYAPAWSSTFHRAQQSGKVYDRNPLYDVTIDLESVNSITSVKANFLRDPSTAVYLPRSFKVWASVDGENWQKLSYLNAPVWDQPLGIYSYGWRIPDNASGKTTDLTDGVSPIKARYVRFAFETHMGHIFIDEIAVNGYEGVVSDAIDPCNTEDLDNEIKLADEKTGNVQDMVLIYQSPTWDTSKLRYYLTYVDSEGKSVDTLYDTFCFLQLSSKFGNSFDRTDADISLEDWTSYLDDTFSGELADAYILNETARQASIDLNDPDYKANVVVMIPFPYSELETFGTINGKSLNLSVEEDWKYLIDWYLGEVESRFEDGNYEYLDLKGFYWVREDPSHSYKIRYFTDKVREMGYKSYWIPFISSEGYFWNEDLGFDAITVQPSHYFGTNTDDSLGGGGTTIIDTVARLGAYADFGVEFELDYNTSASVEKYNLFLDYMNSAAKMGFQGDGYLRNWYEAGGAIWMLAQNPHPEIRKLYDNIYQVIKGTYTPREYISDYSYQGNLLKGKRYYHDVTSWYSAISTDSKYKYLTDGILPTSYYYEGFLGAKNEKSVTIEFNFSDEPLSVREIHSRLMHLPSSGIYPPSNVNIYIKSTPSSGWLNVYAGALPSASSVFRFPENVTIYGLKVEYTNCGQYTFIQEIMAFDHNTNLLANGALTLPTITGDLNNDMVVNLSDFEIMSDYFAGKVEAIDPEIADINADGTLNRVDLLRLAKLVVN